MLPIVSEEIAAEAFSKIFEDMPAWRKNMINYIKDENPELYKCIETLITEAGINNNNFKADNKEFIAWYTTQKGVERFTSLYHAAKEKGLLP